MEQHSAMTDIERAKMSRSLYERAGGVPLLEGFATDLTNVGIALDLYAETKDERACVLYREMFVVAVRRLKTMSRIFSKGYTQAIAGHAGAERLERSVATTLDRLEKIVPSDA